MSGDTDAAEAGADNRLAAGHAALLRGVALGVFVGVWSGVAVGVGVGVGVQVGEGVGRRLAQPASAAPGVAAGLRGLRSRPTYSEDGGDKERDLHKAKREA